MCSELNAEALPASNHFAGHAGAVADRLGVVAFPAPSGAGKSALTAACLATGFAYVSDEALANGSQAWRLAYDHPRPAADLVALRLG